MILILMLLQKSCYSFLWQTVLSNIFGLLTKWTLSFWRPQLFAGTVCLLTAQRFSCSTMKKKALYVSNTGLFKNHEKWCSCSMVLMFNESHYIIIQNVPKHVPQWCSEHHYIIISLYHYIIISLYHYIIISLYHYIIISLIINHWLYHYIIISFSMILIFKIAGQWFRCHVTIPRLDQPGRVSSSDLVHQPIRIGRHGPPWGYSKPQTIGKWRF